MKIIIILLVFLSLFLIDVNAPGDDAVQPGFADMSLCTANGGYCLYDHEVNERGCLNRIRGEDGERLCEGFYENDNREGVEGVNCCGIEEDDNGNANINEGVTLLSVRNIGAVRIGVNGEEPCCVAEGYAPDDGEVCCQGMPTDGGNGRCGCPANFEWVRSTTDPDTGEIIPGYCNARFRRCGWDPNIRENKCTTLGYILAHPIECLFGGPESEPEGPLPYEQVCCPLMEYNGEMYYQPENVVVY